MRRPVADQFPGDRPSIEGQYSGVADRQVVRTPTIPYEAPIPTQSQTDLPPRGHRPET